MGKEAGNIKYSQLFIQYDSCDTGPLYCIHWWDTGQSCSCPRLTGPRSPWSCHSGSQRAHTARSQGDKVNFSDQICIRCIQGVQCAVNTECTVYTTDTGCAVSTGCRVFTAYTGCTVERQLLPKFFVSAVFMYHSQYGGGACKRKC